MRRAALDGPEVMPPGPVIDVTMVLGRKTAAGLPARGKCLVFQSPDSGWGGRIRTSEWEIQSLLAYHLPTPQRTSQQDYSVVPIREGCCFERSRSYSSRMRSSMNFRVSLLMG